MRPLRLQSRNGLKELKPQLDRIHQLVETPEFIASDPVRFMHLFEEKREKEIAGFLAALMAWGRRDVVLRKTDELLQLMDYRPLHFITHYTPADMERYLHFRHRTFRPEDLHGLFSALQQVYRKHEDFEAFWAGCLDNSLVENRNLLSVFREKFSSLSGEMPARTLRHLPDPERNSTCKRLLLFLRWNLRKESPVDPGIWSFLPAGALRIPFDVHVGRQARRLGLLGRRSNDWKAVEELSETLRQLDPADPMRYDFSLFGLGAMGHALPERFLINPHYD